MWGNMHGARLSATPTAPAHEFVCKRPTGGVDLQRMANGMRTKLAACDARDWRQMWRLYRIPGSGTQGTEARWQLRLANQSSPMCLDRGGPAGARIHVWECQSQWAHNQEWRLNATSRQIIAGHEGR